MKMYSCGRYWGIDTPELITPDITKIARSLSRLVRWNGHSEQPWSVAKHSVEVARLLLCGDHPEGPLAGLVGLLHDVQEAYIGDWPDPLRKVVRIEYRGELIPFGEYEKILQKHLLDKLVPCGFDDEVERLLANEVDMRDIVIRTHEFPRLYGGSVGVTMEDGSPYEIDQPDSDHIEQGEFLSWYEDLSCVVSDTRGA